MHKFMRAIGFSNYTSRDKITELMDEIIRTAPQKSYTSIEGDILFAEFYKDFAPNIGIGVRGEYDEENNFHFEYYFPYLRAIHYSSSEDIVVERHAEKESYAGVCDDIKVGVSLIFYLQNVVSYLKLKNTNRLGACPTTLNLSALSLKGSIMMPIEKPMDLAARSQKETQARNQLIAAARQGNEDAIETLTLEDMDMYTAISKKIHQTDVFTLVDTYFMPYGVECDHYSVLGEITACEKVMNSLTYEEMYILTVDCNDLLFDVCINEEDLFGEPEVGRRFKGTIWMQGFIQFNE